MRKYLPIYFILLSFLLTYCEIENKTDCSSAICTMEFRSINIQIRKSSDNTPVVLTSYKVLRTSDNKDITIRDNGLYDNNGYYPIVNDNSEGLTINGDTEVEFQGFINNTMVVSRKIIVSRDCCHVSYVSGDTIAYI